MAVLLEQLTWIEAETVLHERCIVVIPLGAAAKEHGPHLKLNNDFKLAEYFKEQLMGEPDLVILPTVAYHYYPAFVEYPGSVTLSLETARDLIVDICKSISAFGPRKFYVLNTGVSTLKALRPAQELLKNEGVKLEFTDLLSLMEPIEKSVGEQEGGTHADEIETSMMLAIDPSAVDMSKAQRDYHPGQGPLTRKADGGGVFSPTGVFGDPTLATRRKGELIVRELARGISAEIEKLRRQPSD